MSTHHNRCARPPSIRFSHTTHKSRKPVHLPFLEQFYLVAPLLGHPSRPTLVPWLSQRQNGCFCRWPTKSQACYSILWSKIHQEQCEVRLLQIGAHTTFLKKWPAMSNDYAATCSLINISAFDLWVIQEGVWQRSQSPNHLFLGPTSHLPSVCWSNLFTQTPTSHHFLDLTSHQFFRPTSHFLPPQLLVYCSKHNFLKLHISYYKSD